MAFWHIFQKAADKIQAWDFPPNIKKFVQDLSDMLPEKLLSGFVNYIGGVYNREGKEVAGAFIERLIESLKKVLE